MNIPFETDYEMHEIQRYALSSIWALMNTEILRKVIGHNQHMDTSIFQLEIFLEVFIQGLYWMKILRCFFLKFWKNSDFSHFLPSRGDGDNCENRLKKPLSLVECIRATPFFFFNILDHFQYTIYLLLSRKNWIFWIEVKI